MSLLSSSSANLASSLKKLPAGAERADRDRPASHAISRTKARRTRSVFTRLTDEEYAHVERQARGLKVNVYARYVLLQDLTLLEELLALRMIVLNLHGRGLDAVQIVKEDADTHKTALARERMQR